MSDKLEDEIQRGEHAQRLLREPLLIGAFELLEKEYIEQWQNSPARDVEGREKLFLMQKVLQVVQGHLTQAVETGKLAQATLTQRLAQQARELGRKLRVT